MELTFAVAAVIAAAGLLFGLDVAERRRGFAVLALLGAKRNEIAAFLWSEALVVVGPGLAAFAARAPSQKRSGGLGSRCVPDCTRANARSWAMTTIADSQSTSAPVWRPWQGRARFSSQAL